MNTIKLSQLDYRYILIDQYKNLGLTENELVVLLLIDSLDHNKPSLITGALLSSKMNIESEKINEIITGLMNKSFLSYKQVNDILVTSMDNTYQKIVDYFYNSITNNEEKGKKEIDEDSYRRVCKKLEEEMKRSPTPLEIDIINNWFNDQIEESIIMQAIEQCIMKNNKLSIKQVDRIILKDISHKDIEQEGFTTVSEKTKKDIKKAMDEVSYDWVNKDENF